MYIILIGMSLARLVFYFLRGQVPPGAFYVSGFMIHRVSDTALEMINGSRNSLGHVSTVSRTVSNAICCYLPSLT